MKNTLLAKTLTASLPGHPQEIFAHISDPENLSAWHGSFCRSLRRENGSLIAESPRGPAPVRFVRDDHSMVLDLFVEVKEGIELLNAIRLLSNGDGCEIVWTLLKADGISDPIFHEQLRWAGSALHSLRKTPIQNRTTSKTDIPATSAAAPTISDASQPLQAPSTAEISSMPLSGKKLFIGNLSYDWTDEQLREHFTGAGTVVIAEVARFRGRGGRSRGFGFVEMETEDQAQAAITQLHGVLAGGREIIVRIAKSQESRPPAPAPAAVINETPVEPSGNSFNSEAPEPGNERTPRAPMNRHRTERPRRGGGRHKPSNNQPSISAGGSFARRIPGRSSGTGHSYHEVDITNKSGYEIFPRRAPGTPEPVRPEEPAPRRSSLEASPYMDDTGDIENHGRRPPQRRRRR